MINLFLEIPNFIFEKTVSLETQILSTLFQTAYEPCNNYKTVVMY